MTTPRALETTLLGPTFEVDAETVIALTGAPVDALPLAKPVTLRAGERVRIGAARQGLRTYIAFAGGLDVPRVLGSAATDLLTGLGPAPLVKGARRPPHRAGEAQAAAERTLRARAGAGERRGLHGCRRSSEATGTTDAAAPAAPAGAAGAAGTAELRVILGRARTGSPAPRCST